MATGNSNVASIVMPAEIIEGGNQQFNRGAALDYSPTGVTWWHPVSYHTNLGEARQAFLDLPHYLDRDPNHYRILCHNLDVGTEGGAA